MFSADVVAESLSDAVMQACCDIKTSNATAPSRRVHGFDIGLDRGKVIADEPGGGH